MPPVTPPPSPAPARPSRPTHSRAGPAPSPPCPAAPSPALLPQPALHGCRTRPCAARPGPPPSRAARPAGAGVPGRVANEAVVRAPRPCRRGGRQGSHDRKDNVEVIIRSCAANGCQRESGGGSMSVCGARWRWPATYPFCTTMALLGVPFGAASTDEGPSVLLQPRTRPLPRRDDRTSMTLAQQLI